jgi:hypothetical protein
MAQSRPPTHASVLFAPFELDMYELWRSLHCSSSNASSIVPVPTALEYADFQQWNTEERVRKSPPKTYLTSDLPEKIKFVEEKAANLRLADKCKHILQPVHPDVPASPDTPTKEGEIDENLL